MLRLVAPLAATVIGLVLPIAAQAAPGDLVVLDGSGALRAVNPASGATTLISDNARSVAAGGQALFNGDLFGVAREASGDYIVVSRRGSGAPPNPDPSRVIRVNATTGAQSLVAAPASLSYGVIAVAVGKDGSIYVADEFAPTSGAYNDGAIVRIDPATGAATTVADNSRSAAAGGIHHLDGPLGLAVDAAGTLLALDDIAGEETSDDSDLFDGSILRVDTGSGRLVVVSSNAMSARNGGARLYDDARGLAVAPNGDYFVVDNAAINDPTHYSSADAQVIRVDPATGAQSLLADNPHPSGGPALLQSPYGIAVEANGNVVVADNGRVLRIDPATGRQSLVASDLGNALALLVEPGTPANGTPGTAGTGQSHSGSTSSGGSSSGASSPSGSTAITGGQTTSGGGRAPTAPAANTPNGLQAQLIALLRVLVGGRVLKARDGKIRLGRVEASAWPVGTALSFKLGRLGSARVLPKVNAAVPVVLNLKGAGRRVLRKQRRLAGTLKVTVTIPGAAPLSAEATLRAVAR